MHYVFAIRFSALGQGQAKCIASISSSQAVPGGFAAKIQSKQPHDIVNKVRLLP